MAVVKYFKADFIHLSTCHQELRDLLWKAGLGMSVGNTGWGIELVGLWALFCSDPLLMPLCRTLSRTWVRLGSFLAPWSG